MQILLFVITMLLLLSAITYAKMDSYRSMVLFRKRFEVYSEARNNQFEETFYNEKYIKNPMSEKEGTSTPKAEGISYISLSPLLNEKDKSFTKLMLRELITNLYESQKFYQELLKKRPQLTTELIDALENSIKENAKLKKIEELANVDLKDPILAEAFYKILKGFKLPKEAEKVSGETGYPALTCFLTLRGSDKLRPYLAPIPILEVLFNDKQTVAEVINMRTQIYKDLDSDRIKEKEGNALFTEAFSKKLRTDIPVEKVDFSVSKTNPNRKCVRFL